MCVVSMFDGLVVCLVAELIVFDHSLIFGTASMFFQINAVFTVGIVALMFNRVCSTTLVSGGLKKK